MKTVVMLAGLASAFAVLVACFGMFSKDPPATESQVEACAGLSGQALIDCEKRHGK